MERDFDWTRNLPREDDMQRFAAAVAEVITPENYGVRWCAAQFADRDALPLGAQARAEDLLSGYNRMHGTETNAKVADQVVVDLEVLERQACHCDRDGNLIADAPHGVPAEEGDVVRLNMSKRQGMMGGALTPQEKAALRSRGESEIITKDFMVRNGRIRGVPFFHAVGLLQDKGWRTNKPQFKRVDPGKREIDLAPRGEPPKTRWMANWWFREVFDDGTAPPQKQNDDPEALPTRRKRGE